MKKKYIALLALILISGLIRLPVESSLDETIKNQRLREALPSDLSLYEDLGQKGAAAVVGGLRPALATFFYLRAITNFNELRWYELMESFRLINQIQPRSGFYWETAVWHTAWNAASHYRDDHTLPDRVRISKFYEFVDYGIDIAEKGLTYVRNDSTFYDRLGALYTSRRPDPDKAAEYTHMAHVVGGRDYRERIYAFSLVKRAEKESWYEAYEILRRHYDDGGRQLSLIIDLKELEERLGIPKKDRIQEKDYEDYRDDRSALPESIIRQEQEEVPPEGIGRGLLQDSGQRR